jgi:Family of unknown function (DUF6279)
MNFHRLILVLLVALLVGCSGLKIGYRNADTLLAWRAHDYFDFDPVQRHDFDARMERLLAWHRYEQLPEYSVFLSALINKIRPELKPEDIVWLVDGFKERYRIVVNHGLNDAAEMLATLTPEQLIALQKQWDKDNRKFSREHELNGTLAERKRARLKLALSQIQGWTGSLTYEQEQKIAALLEPLPQINHLRHLDRIRRQKEFLELLKLRASKQEFQPILHAWLLDWERGRSPEFEKLSATIYEHRIRFYVAIDKLLTPGQRQIVLHRLQEYADDCKALSAKPVKAAFGPAGIDKLAFFLLSEFDAGVPE